MEGERDQALKAVGELSSRTDSLEEQLERLGRLLEEAQERALDKAQQLQQAEVFKPTLVLLFCLGGCSEASALAITARIFRPAERPQVATQTHENEPIGQHVEGTSSLLL